MSKLERMKISGIRSFGPEDNDAQEIRFHTPLILFLGQNGCGKTTIIEALKFAITGDLPGGTKSGQGFLYDPKLHNGYETRAQIKLKISNIKGDKITVLKIMNVTKKGDKLEFKRLDSTISKGQEQISGKGNDIDEQMCLALGVSKAILNSVIFCHQEDSNWPLEEPKKLKEKFDDIFDATKYNKCHENILKFRKSNIEKMKLLKMTVENLKEKKKEVDSKREDLGEKEEKLKSLKSDIEELHDKIKPIEKRLREIEVIEQNYTKLYAQAESKKNDLKNLKERKTEILSNIKEEFSGTDEELKDKILRFEGNLQTILTDQTKLENEVEDIENQETNTREEINKNQRLLGILQSEQSQHSKRQEDFVKLLLDTTRNLELDLYITPGKLMAASEMSSNLKSVNDKVEEFNNSCRKLEESNEELDRKMQIKVNECRDEHTKLVEKNNLNKQHLKNLQKELQETTNKLHDISTFDKELIFLENRIDRIDKECSAFQASCNMVSLKEEIESDKQKYEKIGEELITISNEVQVLQNYSSLQTELDLKNEDLFKQESELFNLKQKHAKSFKLMFPDDIVSDSMLKSSVESYQATQNNLVKEFNHKTNDKQKQIIKMEANLHMMEDKLDKMEKEVEIGKMLLKKNCDDEQYDKTVEDTHKIIEKLQKDKGTYSSSKYLFQKYIEQFQKEKPCCPICKTKIEEKPYVKNIIDDLNRKLRDFPNRIQETEEKLIENESKYKKLLELKPVYEKVEELEKNEIPELKDEIKQLENDLKEKNLELVDMKKSLFESQKNQELVNNIMSDVSLINKLQIDLTRCKRDIESLILKIPKTDSSRTLQEALAQQESLNINYNTIRNNIDSLRNKLQQHTERLQNFKEQRNEFVNRQLNIKTKLQGKDQLLSKRDDIETKITSSTDELREFESKIGPVKKKLDDMIKLKEKERIENKNKLNNDKMKLIKIQKLIDQLNSIHKQIDDYNKNGTEIKIINIENLLKNLQKDSEEFSAQKTVIIENIDKLKQHLANRKTYYRELQDNVQLREKNKMIIVLSKEVLEFDKKIGDSDITTIRYEKEKMQMEGSKIMTEKSRMEGKMTELKEIITDLKKKLAQPDNAMVSLNYKKKQLELMIKEKTINDLQSFAKSLEWAMMQFHKQRMVQINRIIRDLWRSIYRGNDCDYIEIKTELGRSMGLDKRRVYNYRVVQVKNEIELDMRGRCSAGQKVLASLIIRIALAETFSSNCGILALDEPTTNLDRENISSLSESLVAIINQKQRNKNFQLLIITHDEDFLDKITQVSGAYTYYVVSRNSHGKSVIMEKGSGAR